MPRSRCIPVRLLVAVLASWLVVVQPLALGAHGWAGAADHGHGHGAAAAHSVSVAGTLGGGGGHDHEPADCALCDFVQQGREKVAFGPAPFLPGVDPEVLVLPADRLTRPRDVCSIHALGPRAPPLCT